MLGGCSIFAELAKNSNIPSLAECEKIAQKVALPPIEAGMSKLVLIARYRAALVAANNNLENTKECLAEIDAAVLSGALK